MTGVGNGKMEVRINMNDTCATCRFFKPNPPYDGWCKKKSPGLFDGAKCWPMIASDEWCGDYEYYIPKSIGKEKPHL